MTTRSIPTRVLALACAAGLALTACSDDGDDVDEVVETDAAPVAEEVDEGQSST